LDKTQAEVVAAVRTGASIADAATQVGVNVHTLRRWLSNGRREPHKSYGDLARAVDGLQNNTTDPKALARRFLSAYATYVQSGSDADGHVMRDAARSIPAGDTGKVMAQLAHHFLVATYRQLDPEKAGPGVWRQAFEEMFAEVDEVAAVVARLGSS
jgi:hypothetical protein